jgi:hypothetical protein
VLLQAWLAQKRAEFPRLPETSRLNSLKNSVNSFLGRTCYVDFPSIQTVIVQAQPGIVNMLGQYQTWRMLQAEPAVRAFVAAVRAAGPP